MDKKTRFGIVGTGEIAHRFANAIKNVANAQLVAVASRTKENAEKFGDEFEIKVSDLKNPINHILLSSFFLPSKILSYFRYSTTPE